MEASKIRAEARQILKGKWGKCAIYSLVYLLITIIYSLLSTHFSESSISSIINIIWYIISVPISYGLVATFMKVYSNELVSPFYFLSEGFNNFKKSWGITLQILLKLIGWIALLILSIVLLAIGFAGYLISASTSAETLLAGMGSLGFFALILYLISIIGIIIKSFSYVLSYFILFDEPDLPSKEIVKKSEQLMKNNKSKYFWLCLTFIGWSILSVFTFGIGYLFLIPYIQIAVVVFYKHLLNNSTNNVDTSSNENDNNVIKEI